MMGIHNVAVIFCMTLQNMAGYRIWHAYKIWRYTGNEKCGWQTDGRRTHQSNSRVSYTQPA